MIVLCGKSGSGKNTIQNELVKLGMNRIVTYTTRPMRLGEIDGITYHFISEEEFLQKRESGFFLESTSYFTASGEEWFYGTNAGDFTLNGVLILNPNGIKTLIKKLKKLYNAMIFYLDCSDAVLTHRLKQRGDDPVEVSRRLKADDKDFEDIYKCTDTVLINEDFFDAPEKIAQCIYEIYQQVYGGSE